jgi:hypothetical protein
MKTHPLAELFPAMADAPFRQLCDDIQANGLLNPLVRSDGLLLDGRNRLRACEHVGIQPRFIEFSELKLDCTPEAYIWSQNVARRNLKPDQRAAIAVMSSKQGLQTEAKERQKALGKTGGRGKKKNLRMNSSQGFSKGDTRTRLAKIACVSEFKIQQAETLADKAPELLPKVASGEMTLRAALKIAEGKPDDSGSHYGEGIQGLTASIMAAIQQRVRYWPPG